ncbi:hypothetical protein CW749_07145 [Vibrio sp. vnigr-6D03]|uniref:hypothetical protein n=1 Tax=Vibrio sp. vnigr-6D03 TaxID=2058088 RepID=UPI000C325743|nr:hypothetical protein [Vibrio sp. vnigr-6D03]PKF80335.1 hypothetical protein CW749_07145 [Vibrio sp. vnigr-6D03]
MSVGFKEEVLEEIVVNELRSSDYEELYPLITPPHLGYVDERLLKKVFKPEGPDVVTGLALRASGRLVGCIGFIPKTRLDSDGKLVNTINLTCAVSHPDYRGYGLKLFRQLNKYDNTLFTVLSASEVSDAIFRKICKAKEESNRFQILPESDESNKNRVEAFFGGDGFRYLDLEDKKLYFHHEDLECNQMVFKSGEQSCYIITRKVILQGNLCSEIAYYNNEKFIVDHVNDVSRILKEKEQSTFCVISYSDCPSNIIDADHQFNMKEPRITFGIDSDLPFISLHSENLIFGL